MADSMTRKEFLHTGLAAMVAIPLVACSSDDGNDTAADGSGDGGGDCSGGATANIANNHGHVVDVTGSDISAGAAKDYDMMGTASHTHTLSVSADDMANLVAGMSVSLTSSVTAGHSHGVTLSC
jgi:hypothetical protein